jgi:hypothetical protein
MRETRTVPYETPTVPLNSGPLFRFLMLFALLSTALALPIPQSGSRNRPRRKESACIPHQTINQGELKGTTFCGDKGRLIFNSKTDFQVYSYHEIDDSNLAWQLHNVSAEKIKNGMWRGSLVLNGIKVFAIVPKKCNGQKCQGKKTCFAEIKSNGKFKWVFQKCPRLPINFGDRE